MALKATSLLRDRRLPKAAARKSMTGASNVTVTINPKTGNIDVYCEKEIVENVEVAAQEISLEEAARSIQNVKSDNLLT